MLTEPQCSIIEKSLIEDAEPRKVAAYLCLHMGLMLSEVSALRWQDVDLDAGTVSITHIIGRPKGSEAAKAVEFLLADNPRVLPMSEHLRQYLQQVQSLYADGECFVMTGGTEVPAFYHMQNVLTNICNKYHVANTLSAMDLRNAFIRRRIQAGVDLYSLCTYVGIKQPNVLAKRFAEYLTANLNAVADSAAPIPKAARPRRMNLLILGAGSQGHVVRETAEAIGIFEKIAFLDDNRELPGVLDTLVNYRNYLEDFPVAFVAIGDNHLRQVLIEQLEQAGFIVPVLRHPTATISPTAQAGAGTIFEAKTIVNASVIIGKGVILASASIVDHGAALGDYVHLAAGAMVQKGAVVPDGTKVGSGTIY